MRRAVFRRCNGDQGRRIPRARAYRHRAFETWNDRDIVKLGHGAIDAQPVDAGAFLQIDDLDPAPGLRVSVIQTLIERQSLKPFVARLGQADEGELAPEGQTAQEAGAKDAWLETALGIPLAAIRQLHDAELSGAGIQNPQLAHVHPR